MSNIHAFNEQSMRQAQAETEAKFNGDIASMQSEISSLQSEIQSISQAMAAAVAAAAAEDPPRDIDTSSYEAAIAACEANIEALNQAISALQQAIVETRAFIESLISTMQTLDMSSAAAMQQVQEMYNQYMQYMKQIEQSFETAVSAGLGGIVNISDGKLPYGRVKEDDIDARFFQNMGVDRSTAVRMSILYHSIYEGEIGSLEEMKNMSTLDITARMFFSEDSNINAMTGMAYALANRMHAGMDGKKEYSTMEYKDGNGNNTRVYRLYSIMLADDAFTSLTRNPGPDRRAYQAQPIGGTEAEKTAWTNAKLLATYTCVLLSDYKPDGTDVYNQYTTGQLQRGETWYYQQGFLGVESEKDSYTAQDFAHIMSQFENVNGDKLTNPFSGDNQWRFDSWKASGEEDPFPKGAKWEQIPKDWTPGGGTKRRTVFYEYE